MAEEYTSLIRRLHREAKRRGACDLFTGDEELLTIFKLFKSVRGMEFAIGNGFPEMADLRRFIGLGAADHDIFIDAGRITVDEPVLTVIAGDTDAEFFCSEINRHGTRIYLMHGARATVHASGWAVICIKAMPGCEVKYDVRDQARIL